MPTYSVQAPSGQNISVTGDAPPTEKELDEIFAKVAPPDTPAPVAPQAPVPHREMTTAQRLTTGYADLVTPQDQETAAKSMGRFTTSLASRTGAPAAGQALGAATGPFAPAMIPVLGAIGGALGETGAEFMEGNGFRPGAILAAAGTGAIPGASLAKAGVGTLVKEGAKFGLANVAAKNVETLVDEGRMATTGENVFAGGLGAVAPLVGKALDTGLNKLNQAGQMKALQNSVRDQTLAQAQAAGYVIPPSKVNPSMINNTLESFAGKAATAQEAALRNQEITNSLAAKALGLPGNAPLTSEVLKDLRAESGLAYKKVAALNPTAAQALDDLKTARHEASVQYKFYDRSADPAALKAAKAAQNEADNLEWRLESIATGAKQPGLVSDLRDARKTIAQSYKVERALNLGNGNVSASNLSTSIGRLTDELDTIARFNKAFPQFTREAGSVPSPGVSKLKALTMVGLGTAGASQFGPMGTLAAAAAPLAESGSRGLILSRFGQKMLANPNYAGQPDFAANAARFLTQNTGRDPNQFRLDFSARQAAAQ